MTGKIIVFLSVFCFCIICLTVYIYHPMHITFVYKPIINTEFINYSKPVISAFKPMINPEFIYPYIAVLIEFRSIPLLVVIVMNILNNIPADWPIQIFHGKNNSDFLRNSQLNTLIKSNRIFLHEMESIKGHPMEYTTRLLTNATFWQMVRGEKILFFQLDSIFCSNSPHKLNDFLKYDYIGAPWHSRFNIPAKVGNGGFSLRSRSKILKLLNNHTYNPKHHKYHEDVWFSKFLPLVNATIAPEHIAKTFAVETMFYATPMAVHKPIYLHDKEKQSLCISCPELKIISSFCTG